MIRIATGAAGLILLSTALLSGPALAQGNKNVDKISGQERAGSVQNDAAKLKGGNRSDTATGKMDAKGVKEKAEKAAKEKGKK